MIYNLGSINADIFYDVPHIVRPGETLAATGQQRGLGGKGANQSVAIARAGGQVRHIGAVGHDGTWLLDRLAKLGVDTAHIAQLNGASSGHAIISLAMDGENAIILMAGANQQIPETAIDAALSPIGPGDWLVLQNETNGQTHAAGLARARGAGVIYSAAPFDVAAVRAMLPHTDILVMNQGEAAELMAALGCGAVSDIPVPQVLVTYGANGAGLVDTATGTTVTVDGLAVTPVDTTGAGDTFLGYFVTGMAQGLGAQAALDLANRAAALKVTRRGTADAIPTRADVDGFG